MRRLGVIRPTREKEKRKTGKGHTHVVGLVSAAQINSSFHRKLAASDIPLRKPITRRMNGVPSEIKG